MRLWHYKLIPGLPNKHLVAQWRECCAAAAMKTKGKKHILIDPAWDYDLDEFRTYCALIESEMIKRNFKIGANSLKTLNDNVGYNESDYFDFDIQTKDINIKFENEKKVIFKNFHTDSYLIQCYFMFQERYEMGMISYDEFKNVEDEFLKNGFEIIIKKNGEIVS